MSPTVCPVAKAHDERAEIMHRPDEDRPQEHPQQSWQPAPKNRDCRPDNRPSARNAGKVVPEDDFFTRRHEIDIVAQLPAGNFRRGVELKDAPRQPPPVGMVGDDETDKRADGDQECKHGRFATRRSQVRNKSRASGQHLFVLTV